MADTPQQPQPSRDAGGADHGETGETGETGRTETAPVELGPSGRSPAAAGTTEFLLTLGGPEASEEDQRLLASWLREDQALAERDGLSVDLRERPPGADRAMGLGEDLVVVLATVGVEMAAFHLLRAVQDHLRNRGAEHRTVTITRRVRVGSDIQVRIEVSGNERPSRRELKQLARKLAAEARRHHRAE